jgi:hypothetical protein
MKNDKNQAKAGVRDEDLEALVHQVLRADGKVFPASEKDISNLEAEIDIEEVKPIDPARLLARIRGEKTEESSDKVVPLFGEVPNQVQEDMLAMAARNGGQITEEVRKQMEQDRINAEKRFDDSKSK